MKTTKMFERIRKYKKTYVHNQYARIVEDFKNYDKITCTKMLKEIYKVYEDYRNIIDICTVRELKYLKKLLNKNTTKDELYDKKYEWERETLHGKFLIDSDFDERIFIPDEIIENVKLAVKNTNWNLAKKLDSINEILVSFCKIQGSTLIQPLYSLGSNIANVSESDIHTHISYNKVFGYYVMILPKNIEGLGNNIPIALHQDYYEIEEQLDKKIQKIGLAGNINVDIKLYKTLFYNDFDINNKKIKKMLGEIKKLPFFWFKALDKIREYAVLNLDRRPLKALIAGVPSLKEYNLTEFFKILDAAMDEMPSGVLNGLSPNQAKTIKMEEEEINYEKEKEYIKQKNACLSNKDAKLFYKIYFALLNYTNKKYKIIPKNKICRQSNINLNNLNDIIEKLWNNKEIIIQEFCQKNPNNFNKEELKITSAFKEGKRGLFILAKYYEDYTAVMDEDKIYMIKGLYDNIDEKLSYKYLPQPVIITIIPFKNILIYDGILINMEINMGSKYNKFVKEKLSKLTKYYHL